jgi:ubiquinone/menaquinone biosynthesis C-methylase UbiE
MPRNSPVHGEATTLFRYVCGCGAAGVLHLDGSVARCPSCGIAHPVTDNGAIVFTRESTEQNDYFDTLYKSGKLHSVDVIGEAQRRAYGNSAERAQHYLAGCGVALADELNNASILDVACGSGWITAGLMSHPNVTGCRFHACDISPDGLEILAMFQRGRKSTNALEMSVQNAEQLMFEDATFDFVIGSSALHHFADVPAFLSRCRRILASGGVATFGEPFAVGYGIGTAILMIAQKQVGTAYDSLRDLYTDVLVRVTGTAQVRSQLLDKHLFFQSTFISMARQAGFSEIEFHPFASREFYRDCFIDELLDERGIHDRALARAAKDIYRVMFEIFDADSYAHSLSAFNQIVLRA